MVSIFFPKKIKRQKLHILEGPVRRRGGGPHGIAHPAPLHGARAPAAPGPRLVPLLFVLLWIQLIRLCDHQGNVPAHPALESLHAFLQQHLMGFSSQNTFKGVDHPNDGAFVDVLQGGGGEEGP